MSDANGDWPVALRGVTETLISTRLRSGAWNLAALGLVAGDPVTARTWGETRTRQSFRTTGAGYVQFVTDPVVFVDAALAIVELDEPIHEASHAWTEVTVESIETATDDRWERWAITPIDSTVDSRTVPRINRGFGALIEASVAASRLEVADYDRPALERRLRYCAAVIERTGGPREQEALEHIRHHTDWTPEQNE